MLNFDEWNKTNFVVVDESTVEMELWITSRKTNVPYEEMEATILTFERALELAKEMNWQFYASEDFSSIKIYAELQKELNRPVRDKYVWLAIMNWETKEKLEYPVGRPYYKSQYDLANAILGYKDSYELLSDETKSHFENTKRFVENIVKRNQ